MVSNQHDHKHMHEHTSHAHHHHHHHATGNIKVAFFLNFAFTIIEIIGGIFTNSVAIISDAIHDLGDSLSLGMAWYFQSISKKKGDARYSFGYKRFSLMGAVINAIVLIIGGIFVLQEAIPRLWQPSEPYAEGMMYLAILGIIINGLAVLRLKKGESMNERVVSLHLLEDVLGWVAVLIAAIVMQFIHAPILDPLLSIAITCWVFWNVYKNLKESFQILMQAVPQNQDIEAIMQQIQDLPEVQNIHDIHLWTLDGSSNIFTVHLKVPPQLTLIQVAELKSRVRKMLADKHIAHCTIEVESTEDECLQMC